MEAKQQPNREAFIAYWKDFGTFRWRQLPFYLLYPGFLAVCVFYVRRIDSEGRFWRPALALAIGYVILVPYLLMRLVHKRFARFIRCPNCSDWFGQDASRAYRGPNPKYRGIIETGRCSKCGEQILSAP